MQDRPLTGARKRPKGVNMETINEWRIHYQDEDGDWLLYFSAATYVLAAREMANILQDRHTIGIKRIMGKEPKIKLTKGEQEEIQSSIL